MTVALESLQQKIAGPLSPLQLRELAATLASINLQVGPRPRFFSEIDRFAESYKILAEVPDEVHIPDWDYELHGRIMYQITKVITARLDNSEEIQNLVKSGRYTFLTTPNGTFDADSMELAKDSGTDPEKLG